MIELNFFVYQMHWSTLAVILLTSQSMMVESHKKKKKIIRSYDSVGGSGGK